MRCIFYTIEMTDEKNVHGCVHIKYTKKAHPVFLCFGIDARQLSAAVPDHVAFLSPVPVNLVGISAPILCIFQGYYSLILTFFLVIFATILTLFLPQWCHIDSQKQNRRAPKAVPAASVLYRKNRSSNRHVIQYLSVGNL